MDAIDVEILLALVADARATFSDIASRIGLSAPSTGDRVRRLEERGVIRGYHAELEPASLGLGLTALVAVTLGSPVAREEFLIAIEAMPQVVECHHVAGDDDYVLKVHVDGTAGLEALVSEGLKSVPGVARTRTTIVLSTPVSRALGPEALI